MRILSLVLLALTLISCKTKTVATQRPVDVHAPAATDHAFFNQVAKESGFSSLKMASNITIENGDFIPQLNATIYIQNKQKIWMNISAMFLNVGRGLATPDGIKGYEKWNKTYIDSDFTYLNKLLNVNFINYQAFQNLLVGKVFIPINEQDFILTKNAQGFTLNSTKNQKVSVDGKTSEYEITLDFSANLDLKKVVLQDAKSKDHLQVEYGNWDAFGNERLPKNVKIIIKGEKTDQILIENTKFEFVQMDTPYNVPGNYTKRIIK